MQVLVTGAAGQLGTEVAAWCSQQGDDVTAVARADLDIVDRDQVASAVGTLRPDVVFNCAAYTAVDDCETNVDTAMAANAVAPRWLAEACDRWDAHLVHVSTDYVFDGTKPDPYDEWDLPAPRSVYGRSKLGGEREVLASPVSASVVRTSWVMGAHGSNMLKTVLSLRDRHDLAFVDDQRGCPTFTSDLAVALRRLAAARLPGLFHVTNSGAMSWYEFVASVLDSAGASADQVRPIATAELDPPRPAPRPANSVLANVAWTNAGFDPLPEYSDALRRTLEELGI